MPTSRLPSLSEPALLPDPLAVASASLIQPLATFTQQELQNAEWVCQPSADCMLACTLLTHPKTSEQQLGKGAALRTAPMKQACFGLACCPSQAAEPLPSGTFAEFSAQDAARLVALHLGVPHALHPDAVDVEQRLAVLVAVVHDLPGVWGSGVSNCNSTPPTHDRRVLHDTCPAGDQGTRVWPASVPLPARRPTAPALCTYVP